MRTILVGLHGLVSPVQGRAPSQFRAEKRQLGHRLSQGNPHLPLASAEQLAVFHNHSVIKLNGTPENWQVEMAQRIPSRMFIGACRK